MVVGRSWKDLEETISESLEDIKDIVSRSLIVFEEDAGEGPTESERNIIGNWRKGDTCYMGA